MLIFHGEARLLVWTFSLGLNGLPSPDFSSPTPGSVGTKVPYCSLLQVCEQEAKTG